MLQSRFLTMDRLVIDTGGAHSLLSSDIVEKIGIHFENGDRLLIVDNPYIDFDVFHENIDHIKGHISLDILKQGNMIIDLYRMEMHPAVLGQN